MIINKDDFESYRITDDDKKKMEDDVKDIPTEPFRLNIDDKEE